MFGYDKRVHGSLANAACMSSKLTATVALLAIMPNFLACAQQPEDKRAQAWLHEINFLLDSLTKHHPDPYTQIGSVAFKREAEALKKRISNLTEEQRVVQTMQLVALLGDGHTTLQPKRPDFSFWYPVRFYEFTDGLFVTSERHTHRASSRKGEDADGSRQPVQLDGAHLSASQLKADEGLGLHI